MRLDVSNSPVMMPTEHRGPGQAMPLGLRRDTPVVELATKAGFILSMGQISPEDTTQAATSGHLCSLGSLSVGGGSAPTLARPGVAFHTAMEPTALCGRRAPTWKCIQGSGHVEERGARWRAPIRQPSRRGVSPNPWHCRGGRVDGLGKEASPSSDPDAVKLL